MQLFDTNGTEVQCAASQVETLLKSGWTKTKKAKKVEVQKPAKVTSQAKPQTKEKAKPAKSEG